jgi:3-dehydroquinate dehydratase I
MICISIQHKTQLEALTALNPEMLELRFDLINESSKVIMPLVRSAAKIIATCRPGKLSREERLQLLKEAIDMGAALIDLEIESDDEYMQELIAYAKEHNTEVIISWHNFERTPEKEELEDLLEECYAKGADIAKIATFVNDESDNAKLLSLYTRKGRKVVLGMGENGKITRFAATQLGAEFTFASMGEGSETAPGQITIEEFAALNKILRP